MKYAVGRYLCFLKHRLRNLNTYLNICSRESIFFERENDSSIKFNDKENGDFEITSHVKVFLGSKYIHTARNAKVTSTRNVYKKINET